MHAGEGLGEFPPLNLRSAPARASGFEAKQGSLGPTPRRQFDRIVVSDSSSVNRPSGSAGHSDSDPFFIPGIVPGPPEEEEMENPAINAGGDRVAEDNNGPPSPGGETARSAAGPSGERKTPKEAKAYDFHQGRRLGRLENRVVCLEAEIRRLQGQLAPLREKLHYRRMVLGEEFGLDTYVAGGFSSDED
jgi:hypothetical protein